MIWLLLLGVLAGLVTLKFVVFPLIEWATER